MRSSGVGHHAEKTTPWIRCLLELQIDLGLGVESISPLGPFKEEILSGTQHMNGQDLIAAL